MTTTVPTHGGPAVPVSSDTSGKTMGRVALRAYGFPSEADAIAAGFHSEAGPASSVYVVSAAELVSGKYVLEGDPKATPIYTAPAGMRVEGGYSQPVYLVGGNLSNSIPVPVVSTLLTGLSAYFNLSNLADSTSSVTDLTNNGTVTFAAGKQGNAAQFNGSNQWLSHADTAKLQCSGDMTLACWMKRSTVEYGGLICKDESSKREFAIISETGGLVNWYMFDASNNYVPCESTDKYTVDQWYLIIAWYSSVDQKIYLQINDGTPKSAAFTGTPKVSTAAFTIGKQTNNNFYLTGLIDEVGKWNRVLTAGERALLWNGSAGRTYPFNETTRGYTAITPTINGQATRILIPTTYSGNAPLVIANHAYLSDQDFITADSIHTFVCQELTAAGYIVASTMAHGDSWGNAASVADNIALYNYLTANYSISRVALWSSSMGAQVGLNIVRDGTIPIKGWLGNSPATDLNWLYTTGGFSSSINTAYNIPGGGNYATQTAGRDPILFAASVYDGLRMRFYASASDTTVSKTANTDALATLVSGHATESDVVTTTGAHSDPSQFKPDDYLAFFNRCV